MRKSENRGPATRKHLFVAAALVVAGLAPAAMAAPVIDGTRDAEYGSALSVQKINTSFGNNQSELDAAYANVVDGRLNLFFAGNVESNFNRFVLFIDSKAGGQNQLRGDNAFGAVNRAGNSQQGVTNDGLIFDSAFSPDYVFVFNRDTGTAYVDFGDLNTNGGGSQGYAGLIPLTGQIGSATIGGTGGIPVQTWGYNDANVLGVGGAGGSVANDPAASGQSDPTTVTTGVEFSISLADIGGPTGDIRIASAIAGGGGLDFFSNQFLGALEPGSLPPGTDHFAEPRGKDLNLFAGDQFFTVAGVVTPVIQYAVNADGNYSNGANFTGGVSPNGPSARVTFGTNGGVVTGARTVTLDVPVELAQATFSSPSGYTLAGTNALTISAIITDPGLNVTAGSNVISAPVIFTNAARVNVETGASLTLTQAPTAAGKDVFKQGGGTFAMPATAVNSITVNAGTLRLTGNGNTPLRGATIDAGATLDLTNTALVLDYDADFSPLAALKAAAVDGRLSSSTRSADRFGIGYLDTAANPAITSYNGTPVDANTLVFVKTLKGDSNLNLTVEFDDLLALAQNYDPAGTGKEWYQGDSNYDGVVNFDDLLSLAQNYNGSALTDGEVAGFSSSFAADWALAQSLVPEPTTLAAMAGVSGMVLRRRRSAR